ncbi:MAG: hypothetical protein KDG44_07580, partial [Burkholderiaceae bacterium]|nr:hypothetical protein [Burkholderiaceae bacterium]
MLTNLMTIAPETPAGKTTGPNRYPPQTEGTATDRFATLLQQRRQSSPESSPESSQKAPPQSQPPVKASQPQPEPKQAPKTAAPRDAEGNTGTDGTKADAAGNAPETDAAPQASTGCETAHPKGLL